MFAEHFFLYHLAFWASGVVFALPAKRREKFGIRLSCCAAVVAFFSTVVYFLPGGKNMWTDGLCRAAACGILWLALYICWDISPSTAYYDMVWGVSVWQVAAEAVSVMALYGKRITDSAAGETIGIAAVYLVTLLLCYLTIARWMPRGRKERLGPRQLALTTMLFCVINLLSFHEKVGMIATLPYEWGYFYLIQMICVVVLYLEGELFKKSQMRQEMEMLNFLYTTQKEQYRLSRENISLINQKCHDLKHQIRAIRNMDKAEIDKYLGEIEDSVKIYEAIVKTGNDVFDTILTEKSLYCKDRQIRVSCVADAGGMDFIDKIDLYSILGNAMDNAIEAVEKLREKEKRQIDVMIYRQQNFLVMNIINPLPERLTYKEGVPVTTKSDRNFHGFGIPSMKQILKKYDGFLNISEEDGCFSLKMLVPIPGRQPLGT